MKRKVLILLSLLLTMGQAVMAQSVFSPTVNGLRSHYQTRRAAARQVDVNQEHAFFVVTCSLDASTAAIANELQEMGVEVSALMGNQLVIDMPMSMLDAVAAIEGVVLIDHPSDGTPKTDIARKASHVNEVHQGKCEGLQDLPQAYTGKGVIVGLIDMGFDFTHPMFKDKDGNLRIKGVYMAGEETYRNEGESLENIPTTDEKGNTTSVSLRGSFFTNPDVILDTLKLKNLGTSHGTHCASIAAGTHLDYKDAFKGKDDNSGKLGGMAPEADLFMAYAGVTKEQEERYPAVKNNLGLYNKLQAMYAMKHFADKQGKPLVISWSVNSHEGLHDGSSTMARYIGNYCKQGNVMALCASNEGEDKTYIDREISQGNSVKVWAANLTSTCSANFFIRTDKEIKVDLVIADFDCNAIYNCNLPLSSKATETFQREFFTGVVNEGGKKKYVNDFGYYDQLSSKLCDYINHGYLYLFTQPGQGIDKNNQSFPYVQITLRSTNFDWESDVVSGKQKYFPMLVITSPDGNVRVQGWGDYNDLFANSVEDPTTFKAGTMENSMGDWCTSGETVSVGAYVTDNRVVRTDKDTDIPYLAIATNQEIGKYATFSSFGHDFSAERLAYPDVSAPGYAIYAAGNSFAPGNVYSEVLYSGQFKGQTEDRYYPYSIMSGTSMSTPAAAGIIALWQQAAKDKNKKLTNKDIKDIIKATSDTDDYTKAEPLRYGAGKINAYKGLLYVLDLYNPSGINTISTHQPDHVTFRLEGNKLYTEGAEEGMAVSLYNLQGVCVGQTTVQSGAILLDGLTKGVYAVQLGKLGSTLIRL